MTNFCLSLTCTSKFLLSGSQYWVFKDTIAMDGYPRPLSDWGMITKSGVPVDRVDAAFIWAHNGKTYLFSGDEFWRFDESRYRNKSSRWSDCVYRIKKINSHQLIGVNEHLNIH